MLVVANERLVSIYKELVNPCQLGIIIHPIFNQFILNKLGPALSSAPSLIIGELLPGAASLAQKKLLIGSNMLSKSFTLDAAAHTL